MCVLWEAAVSTGLASLGCFFEEIFRDGAHWRDSNYPSLYALARGRFIIPDSLKSDLLVGSSALCCLCWILWEAMSDRARLLRCRTSPLNPRQSRSPAVMWALKDGRVFLDERGSSVISSTKKKKLSKVNCHSVQHNMPVVVVVAPRLRILNFI